MSSEEINIAGWLAEGFRLHQLGQFSAAQEYYRKILTHDNKHADALFLLGTCYLQLNDPHQSINFIQQALTIEPNSAAIHINLANAFQAVGKKSMAVSHFEKAIELEPNNYDAHYNLAVNLASQSLYKDAVKHYLQTIKIKPDHISAMNNLGIIYQSHGNHDEAIKCYRAILALQEPNIGAHYNLANSLQAKYQYPLAVNHYQRVITLNAQHWMAYLGLGQCYDKLQRNAGAISAYQQVIKIKPDYIDAYYFLGKAFQADNQYQLAVQNYQLAIDRGFSNKFIFYYAGTALDKMDDFEGAINAYYHALTLDTENEKIYHHLGDALQKAQRYEEAVLQYKNALLLNPRSEEVLNNLGCALGSLDRYDEAIDYFHRALNVRESYVEAYNNLGCTLMELNKLDEAIEQFDRAISFKPDYKDAFWNKGLAYLCQGKLAQGWPLYEYRPTTVNNQPLANYENLFFGDAPKESKKIFIESEQGFGDIIQILRYVNLAMAQGVECWVKVPPALHNLAQRSFPAAHIISDDVIPNVPNRIALLSLPLVMKTFSESSIPNTTPYLIPDPIKVEQWKHKIATNDKKRVGIFWRGQRKPRNDNRSLLLEEITPLFSNENIQFIILQKNITTPDFIELQKFKNVTILEYELVDFDETAAVMANLDVMISVDSAPVHMAGAIGIKTFALLPFAVDWRWMNDRTDSPWYPSTTLFRQKKPADWSDVVREVKSTLDSLK